LPETHEFLKKVRQLMDEEYPDAVLIAEANQWPEDLLPYFGDGDEFHMCFHFPIMPRLYQALKAGEKTPIVEILGRTPDIPDGTQWMTFLRNHDELTLEMVTPQIRQWMWEKYAPEPRMRQNLGIRRRLAPLLDNDKRKWRLLNALFLSLPGAPIIYYGDEIGMGDNIWLPDRHGCRTPMHWTAEKNGGFSAAEETYMPALADEEYGFNHVNVAAQEGDPDSYLWLTRMLLKTRKEQAALRRRGSLEWINTHNSGVLAYIRGSRDEKVVCVYNLTAERRRLGFSLAGEMMDLLAPEEGAFEAERGKVLAPHAAHWLVAA
jgi:maltose alpha-D-glucosyltransferase/alpha-amylase